MVMCIHRVSDGLIGNRFLDGVNDGQGARVIQRAFDQRDVILELNCHAMMRAARQVPHAFGDFLRFDLHHRRLSFFDILGHGKHDVGIVGVGFGDGQIEHRESALLLNNVGWERHIGGDLA